MLWVASGQDLSSLGRIVRDGRSPFRSLQKEVSSSATVSRIWCLLRCQWRKRERGVKMPQNAFWRWGQQPAAVYRSWRLGSPLGRKHNAEASAAKTDKFQKTTRHRRIAHIRFEILRCKSRLWRRTLSGWGRDVSCGKFCVSF